MVDLRNPNLSIPTIYLSSDIKVSDVDSQIKEEMITTTENTYKEAGKHI